METPETIRISLQQGEWVTSLDFSDAYFHIFSNSSRVQEVPQVPFPKSILPVSGPPLQPINCSDGVHLCGQRGQVNDSVQGYKDPPVPRRLVDSSPYQRILPPGHPIPLPGVGLGRELTKVRVRTRTDFRVCGFQVRSLSRTGPTDPEPLGVDSPKGGIHSIQTKLPSQEIYVPDRPAYSNRKTSTPGVLHMRPIQWHLKRHWRVPESLEKEIPVPRSLHSHLVW